MMIKDIPKDCDQLSISRCCTDLHVSYASLEYETFDVAHKNIKKFLEIVYNRKRVHSSLGYVTPEEFENS